jgi:hypothetical protein
MAHPVEIENDAMAIEVWPQFGGKVTSVVDKADGFELLFSYPVELPEGPCYDVGYTEHWHAGWDECFPAVAPSKYSGHPYDGISVPDHGELWGLPTTAVPTRDGITCVWNGLRFGYRLTRKLYLDGPTLVANYTLVNIAPFEFRFVWSMHALLSMIAPMHLESPGSKVFRLSHDEKGTDIQMPFDWPMASPGEDLSHPDTLPPRRGWKSFSADPIESKFIVHYPTRGRSVQIEYASEDELPAYWGLWVSTGGWGGNRHLAVEPTTGRFDQIDRSIRDGSAGRVAALGRREWTVRWTLQ